MTTITAPFTSPSIAAASPQALGGGRFSTEQIAALAAPLDRAKGGQREQGRTAVSSIEGWQVIASGCSRERILQLEPADIDEALADAAWRMEEREEALVLT